MNKEQYSRLRIQKRENKLAGRAWGRLYGILARIHKEIDPIIAKRNKALENLPPELN